MIRKPSAKMYEPMVASVKRGKLVDVVVVASWHPLCSHDKLRQEGHIKADKNEPSSNLS